jgi:DNA-binding protein HU-beta
VNKSELVQAVSDRTSLTRKGAEEAVDALVATIVAEVNAGQKVSLIGFGTYNPTRRAARTGRNPRTGAAVKIAASKGVRFAPGSTFKAILNGKATAPARKAPAAKPAPARKAAAKKTVAKKAVAKKAVAKKAPARKAVAKKVTAKKTVAKKIVAKKAPARKTVAKKVTAKRAPARKTVAKKAPARRAPARKVVARKAVKKTVAKKRR